MRGARVHRSLARARRARSGREIELAFGEVAARRLAFVIDAGATPSAIAAWATDADTGLGEVFAEDDALLARASRA